MYFRIRYVDVKFYFIRKTVEDGYIEFQYVVTVKNVADVLIKVLFRDKYKEYIVSLGLCDSVEYK